MSCASKPPADESPTCDGDSMRDSVKEYYGKQLQNTSDIETGACQMPGMPEHVRQVLELVHEDVINRYYGSGITIPDGVEGTKILDIGSGAGMDSYILSNLVGEKGHVTGIDMTEEQFDISRKYIDYHTKTYGYKTPNIDFVKGYIEKLGEAGIRSNVYDIVVSNGVLNLCPDKQVVLKEAYNVLKEGGELYFSDIYCDRIVADNIKTHKGLCVGCISGALWWKDLYTIAAAVGFSPPRLVTASTFSMAKEELKAVLGDCRFVAATYRLFKLPKDKLSPGEVVYKGQIPHCENNFMLDHNLTFKTGEACCIDSEVMTILRSSRFSGEFTFQSASQKICTEEQVKNISHDPFIFSESQGPQDQPAGCCQGQNSCST